ncbi:hypothetical protein [Natrinema hispanicum]|uniref:Dolichyl-phosphate-mannose-protein mannosyltransferase n=1 Tax=Natrinema hispanicum TaxID=392421 RepID=A0A1G6WUS1_9EURY|nr:hypothetical protein [Natrinema hispanicum]SDD69642.1 Dolichyl-phosphate-mannose-protein mannosyltransferase [Natrinema hispanicum]
MIEVLLDANSRIRLLAIVGIISFALMVVGSSIQSSLYPTVPFFMIILSFSVAFIAIIYNIDHTETYAYIVFVILFSTAIRLYMTQFPASLVGLDPDQYAIQIKRVIESGNISTIQFEFYQTAPLFILSGVIVALVAGLSAELSLLYATILLSIVAPLASYLFGRRLSSPRGGVVAGAITLSGTTVTRFSIWPIAQTLAVVVWVLLGWTTIRYFEKGGNKYLVIIAVFAVASIFIHKLSPLIFFVGSGAILAYTMVANYVD